MAFESLRTEEPRIAKAAHTEDGFVCKLEISAHHFIVHAKTPDGPLLITRGSTMNGLPTEDDLSPAAVRLIRKTFEDLALAEQE